MLKNNSPEFTIIIYSFDELCLSYETGPLCLNEF